MKGEDDSAAQLTAQRTSSREREKKEKEIESKVQWRVYYILYSIGVDFWKKVDFYSEMPNAHFTRYYAFCCWNPVDRINNEIKKS